MDKNLASIIDYFAIFEYFPEKEDVYTFFPVKISEKRLNTLYEAKKYTVGEYSKNNFRDQKSRLIISKKKLKNWRFRAYIKLISLFPQVRLIGLSGSISMMNAKVDDDIDLFIISARNRLFTSRFIALIMAQFLGLRRKIGEVGVSNKVCLNLFFDERDLKIPKFKQSIFVGHEVLQMKPILNKDRIYEQFLMVNSWVFRLFPNAKTVMNINTNIIKSKRSINFVIKFFGDWLEKQLKMLQLESIKKHQTTEIITNTQLWFHPDDFEKKIK